MPEWDDSPQVHDAAGVERMRAAGRLAAEVLDMAGSLVRPGVTTDAIDKAVHKMTIEAGAYPSPLNYGAFPKSVCTSINECICHGARGGSTCAPIDPCSLLPAAAGTGTAAAGGSRWCGWGHPRTGPLVGAQACRQWAPQPPRRTCTACLPLLSPHALHACPCRHPRLAAAAGRRHPEHRCHGLSQCEWAVDV